MDSDFRVVFRESVSNDLNILQHIITEMAEIIISITGAVENMTQFITDRADVQFLKENITMKPKCEFIDSDIKEKKKWFSKEFVEKRKSY